MQPGTNPDDIHTILGRYQTWAERQPGQGSGNGHKNGHSVEGIRELTYEEAKEQHRSRTTGLRQPRTKAARTAAPALAAAETARVELSGAVDPSDETQQGEPQRCGPLPQQDADTPVAERLVSPQEELPFAAEGRAPAHAQPKPPAPESAQTGRRKMDRRGAEKRATTLLSEKNAKPAKKAADAPVPAKVGAGSQAAKARAVTAKPLGAAARPGKNPAAKTGRLARRHPEFRQVLARSLNAAVKKAADNQAAKARKKGGPERTRRITTRFSSGEERRLERAAGQAGMTVSAYLRKCALAAEQTETGRATAQPSRARTRHKGAAKAEPANEVQLFAQPATTSLVGGWLTLLRQRFLSSPARFAEQA